MNRSHCLPSDPGPAVAPLGSPPAWQPLDGSARRLRLAFGLGWEGRGVWIGLAIALMAAAVLMTWRFEYLTRRHKLGAEA